MHIIYVTTEFVTDENFYGGLANYTANMASVFAVNSNIVTVLIAGVDYNSKIIKWKPNVNVEYINFNDYVIIHILRKFLSENPDHKFATRLLYTYRGYIIKSKINSINNKNKVDFVHYCNLLAVGLIRNKKIPCVVRMSSFPGLARHTRNENFDINKAIFDLNPLEQIELEVIKKTRAIISPSKITANLVKQTINRKITVLESPFCINYESWDRNMWKSKLDGKKYILFFGSLSREKGIYVIDKIIYEFLKQNKDYYFVLIGEEKNIISNKTVGILPHKKIEISAKEYSDRIFYFRAMEKEKLFPFIENAYACALPSIMDNLPNTCIEAMGLGKLVIGTYGASFDQLIINGYNGLLCERESPQALLDTLNYAVNISKFEKRKIENNAIKRISSLKPEKLYEKYFKYYQKIIAQNK